MGRNDHRGDHYLLLPLPTVSSKAFAYCVQCVLLDSCTLQAGVAVLSKRNVRGKPVQVWSWQPDLGEHAQLSMHGSFLVDPLIKLPHAHYRLENILRCYTRVFVKPASRQYSKSMPYNGGTRRTYQLLVGLVFASYGTKAPPGEMLVAGSASSALHSLP